MDVSEEGGETEMQRYLQESGMDQLLKSFVAQLVSHKPEKPVRFLLNLLQKHVEQEDADMSLEISTTTSLPPVVEIPSHLLNRKRRGGVSGEPATEVTITTLEINSTPKGKEANARLDKALQNTMICSHLDDSDRKEIFDAMSSRTYKANEKIIEQGA